MIDCQLCKQPMKLLYDGLRCCQCMGSRYPDNFIRQPDSYGLFFPLDEERFYDLFTTHTFRTMRLIERRYKSVANDRVIAQVSFIHPIPLDETFNDEANKVLQRMLVLASYK